MLTVTETLKNKKMKNNDLIIDVEWGLGTAYYYYGTPEIINGQLIMTHAKSGKCSTFNGDYAWAERFIETKIKSKFPNKNVYWRRDFKRSLNL